MLKTGNSFADYFLVVIAFLPLLPAVMILLQKNFAKEPLHLLLIICLVNFIRDFPIRFQMLTAENQSVLHNVCYPVELTLLALLFKNTWTTTIRAATTIILVAFLSALLTWLSAKGWSTTNPGLQTLQNGMLVLIILLSLPPLVRSMGLDIFRSCLFWIAGGTLFYLLILLLLEWITPCCDLNTEDKLILSIAGLIRYSLYLLAIRPGRDERPVEKKTL